MSETEFLGKLSAVNKTSNGWQACCPAHEDGKASLSISIGKDGRTLLKCFAGCSVESIVSAMGLQVEDLFPSRATHNCNSRILATYDYTDENGNRLFQCVRRKPKDFRQRRPDPAAPGKWLWNLKGVRKVLFRLPEVLATVKGGQPVFIAEGEKDALALVSHGFCGTCNSGGAGKWRDEYNEPLAGATVVVISDKDEPGRKHTQAVANSLCGKAKSIRVIELPDRNGNPVKDSADFFAAGGTADELRAIVDAAPEFIQVEAPDGDSNADPDEEDSERPPRKSAATRLVKFADEFAFFHDRQSRAFVRLDVNRCVEVWPVNSTQFRNLLAQTFYKRTRTAINRNALADAIATLSGRACFDSPEEPVFLRVAPHGENILIDLCDPKWRVVEVTPIGWRVLEKSPVAFMRTGAMRALPSPVPSSNGSLDQLWGLLNATPVQRPLIGGALLNGFTPHGPYFVTNYIGEQGSAKSCAAKIHRLVIDPNENPLRSPPREERDLLVHAANNWCVAFDNLSGLVPWLSDGICRLATGGGHSARQLYTDGEEFSLAVKRPVILNGIEDVATRPDLAERALQIELETIPDNRRIPEKELWQKFEQARPVIFSGLLNALACALRNLPSLKLDSLPRMADAALFATSGETALGWSAGTFMSAYCNNLNEGAIASVDAHPVGVVISQLLEGTPEWTGEPTQLLKALNAVGSDELKRARNWPQNSRSLSMCLRRLAQALRRAGFELEFSRSKRRSIRLCKRADVASPASPATCDSGGLPRNQGGAEGTPADANDANLQALHVTMPTDTNGEHGRRPDAQYV